MTQKRPVPPILKQHAIVYVEDPATERYDIVHNPDLRCWQTYNSAARTGPIRVEFTESRQLLWDPNYVMPHDARVKIGDEMWAIEEGSVFELYGPRNDLILRRSNTHKAIDT